MPEDNLLYTTWGRELATALGDICECSGQDAHEVLFATFDRKLSLEEFHALNGSDFARISDSAKQWFETDRIEAAYVQKAVESLRWHWPIEKI